MNTAQSWIALLLDFLAAIAWPLLIGALLIAARKPIGRFLDALIEVRLAHGATALTLLTGDRSAEALETKEFAMPTDKAQPIPDGRQERYDDARFALTSPQIAPALRFVGASEHPTNMVRLCGDALQSLVLVVSRYVDPNHSGEGFDPGPHLAAVGAPDDLAIQASDLWALRSQVVTGATQMSGDGAESYGRAVAKLGQAIVEWAGLT